MNNEPNKMETLFGFEIYPKWHCSFPVDSLSLEQIRRKFTGVDPRIAQLLERMDIKGKCILELGALEGMHTFMLESAGADEIIAIEGRKENFLKCLLIKNAYKLHKSTFLHADIEKAVYKIKRRFDLCLALGILYHLENPVRLLKSIGEKADNIFLWSHYAKYDYPEGQVCEIQENGQRFKGKYVKEDTQEYLSGIKIKSLWMLESSLMRALENAGFKNIEIIDREDHEHGPALTLFGKK